MMPLYAWPTLRDPLTFALDDIEVDGSFRPDLMEAERRTVHLAGVSGWTNVRLGVQVETPSQSDAELLDSVHVLVSAPRTQTRRVFRLLRRTDVWVGSVELPRVLLAGAVTLAAEATAKIDGRVRLVGRSEQWRLVVDPGEAPAASGGAPFPMVWIDFAAQDAPDVARRNRHVHAVMALDPSPTLYLNDGIEGLRALLAADTARGERRRARDLLGSEVARLAVGALVRAAVAEVADSSDDEPTAPAAPLLRQTLEATAGAMSSPMELSELCERIGRTESGSAADRAGLWCDIDAAVLRLCSVSEAVADIAKEARNV